MDYLLQVFKALAHDRRLRIIELLSERREFTIEVLSSELKIPFASWPASRQAGKPAG